MSSLPPLANSRACSSVMTPALASNALVDTRALGPNQMPLGLSSSTWPLEVSTPMIFDGSLPMTRFRVTEVPSGCWIWTLLSGPMLNRCQLIPVRGVLVSICMFGPLWLMAPWPEMTWPPWGSSLANSSQGAMASPAARAMARNKGVSARRWGLLSRVERFMDHLLNLRSEGAAGLRRSLALRGAVRDQGIMRML
ncbi:hypothetical protein D3C77_249700 [compost metagenome]